MSQDEEKSRGIGTDPHHHQQQHYGTFQGYPQPAIGFPQPIPPPGSTAGAASAPPYYPHPPHGYQAVPVAEGRPVREPRLPCCGIGLGWFLFIIGFFLAGIPWYMGAFILMCSRVDYREKPGFVACTVAGLYGFQVAMFIKSLFLVLFLVVRGILEVIAIILGVSKGTHSW